MTSRPDPRHGIWILPLVIVAMVGSTVVFVNSLSPDEPGAATTPTTAAPGTSTTTSTVVATSITTPPLEPAVQAYLTIVDGIANTADELVNRAVEINQEWDDRAVTFNETLDRLNILAADTTAFVVTVEAATPSDLPELEPSHLDIVLQARALGEAADAMVVGLQDPNSSEGRKEALVEYQDAGSGLQDAVTALRIRAGAEAAPADATADPTDTTGVDE